MKAKQTQDEADRKGAQADPSGQSPDHQSPDQRKDDEKPDSVWDADEVPTREAAIDAAVEMTFPASDPPSWSP